jgi:HEAT repeat protein
VWCCWRGWSGGAIEIMACPLDSNNGGFTTRDRDATTDAVMMYARLSAGKVERLGALSADCPVETRTPVQELTNVASDDSARWLIAQVKEDAARVEGSVGENALGALAVHRGDLAHDALIGFTRDSRPETRKWSIFWLAMVRGEEGAQIASSVMFNDQDAEVRKHASFALAQSKSPRVAPDLIRLGNTDKDDDVRAQAWFWLAQTGKPEAEAAIAAAVRKDTDDHVREQAVFALSQLPEERGTKALIAVAEDRSLPREQRKRAVFWLAQSKSDSALAYLEKVLALNSK